MDGWNSTFQSVVLELQAHSIKLLTFWRISYFHLIREYFREGRFYFFYDRIFSDVLNLRKRKVCSRYEDDWKTGEMERS